MKQKIDQIAWYLGQRRRIKKEVTTILILSVVIMLSCFSLIIYNYSEEKEDRMGEIGTLSQDENMKCHNMTLQETSHCLRKFVKSIFNYTRNSDKNILSLEQLKEIGGDCLDWTRFYEYELEERGFSTNRTRIFIREEEDEEKKMGYYHVFLTAYDETGYCNLDMKDVHCFTYNS